MPVGAGLAGALGLTGGITQLLKILGITGAIGVGSTAASSIAGQVGSKTIGLGAAGPIGFAGGAGYGLGIRTGFEQIYAAVKGGLLSIADALSLINEVSAGGVSEIGANFAADTQSGSIAGSIANASDQLLPTVNATPTSHDDRNIPYTATPQYRTDLQNLQTAPASVWQWTSSGSKSARFEDAKKDAIKKYAASGRDPRKIIRIDHKSMGSRGYNRWRFTIHYNN